MITEDDLGRALRELADEAPERCSSFDPAVRHRRARTRAVTAGAVLALGMAVVAAVAVVAGVLAVPGRNDGRPAGVATSPASAAPVIPDFRGPAARPPATVTPTLPERLQLAAIALENATINGDATPHASAVATTLDRLCDRHPSLFCTGSTAQTAHLFGLGSVRSAVWVVWITGHFDGNNGVIAILVTGSGLRDRAATSDVDTGDGVSATQLADLGVVVRLR